MAKTKKVVTEKPVEKNVFSQEEVQAALEVLNSEYFMQTVALLTHLPDRKELLYSKVAMSTPDGGLYLVSILHIEGPVLDLSKLGKAADEAEKK